ncbi:type II/IV secretion system ATPase subunit [Methanocella conradii]|uniref:type II/IV secretion system ATPase subunit n=1 Tax=Methanocella conradii TaxID=1175444 RepID=UPI0024B3B092|nr:type II/IV secretion system ATPase subunit [Methanocella conradii]MDI6897129.1 type II/IV secretion system ATPase subunit [Methanocella conradii]
MSLSREALLSVDDDGPRKKLGGAIKEGLAIGPAIEEQKASPPTTGNMGAEVVKSYRINGSCGVQIIWDDVAGKCRYELLEPTMSPDECRIYEGIISELHKKPRAELEAMKKIGGRERIRQKFERLCMERSVPGPLKEKMRYYVERDFWGYKKIDALLKDPNVEDVSCNGYGSPVYVYVPEFESIPTNITFSGEDELDDFILYLVQKGGKSISAAHPIQDVALPDGSRLNGTIYREVSSNGTTFSIRVANRTRRAAELLRQRTFSPESMAFLWLAMENRCSMAFIGGTASGKTAALNAVSGFITDRHKVVTIEDTREVRLASQNWTPLVVRETGESPISEFDLLVAAFRQRPEYVIVGEVRTPEGARAAIHGINSGHTVLMTFHAESAWSFFNRIMNAPFNIPPHTAASLSLCVNLAMVSVQPGPVDIKVRRCRSICELAGVNDDGTLSIHTLFEWDPAADSISMIEGPSKVLEKIRSERVWSEDKLIEELSARAAVLRWVGENNVGDEERIKKIVESFYRDRKGLLRFMKEHPSFKGDITLGDYAYD